jgi:LysB family phage lysis regulatory protein
MFDFKVSTHTHYDDACRKFALAHNMEDVANREMIIQRETDANPILRDWSAAALPDDVIRLYARPAFASARDYLDWVSARDKLPGAGKQP